MTSRQSHGLIHLLFFVKLINRERKRSYTYNTFFFLCFYFVLHIFAFKISNIPTLAKGDNNTFAMPDIQRGLLESLFFGISISSQFLQGAASPANLEKIPLEIRLKRLMWGFGMSEYTLSIETVGHIWLWYLPVCDHCQSAKVCCKCRRCTLLDMAKAKRFPSGLTWILLTSFWLTVSGLLCFFLFSTWRGMNCLEKAGMMVFAHS